MLPTCKIRKGPECLRPTLEETHSPIWDDVEHWPRATGDTQRHKRSELRAAMIRAIKDLAPRFA